VRLFNYPIGEREQRWWDVEAEPEARSALRLAGYTVPAYFCLTVIALIAGCFGSTVGLVLPGFGSAVGAVLPRFT
jgi:hypothetical protein